MRYKFPVTVTDVIERKCQKHVSGVGKDAVFQTDIDGWYVCIGNQFSIFVGKDKPNFVKGQKIFLLLREQ